MTLISKVNRAAGAVVKMLASGQTAAYVSKALGVSENLIYRRKNQNRSGQVHALWAERSAVAVSTHSVLPA